MKNKMSKNEGDIVLHADNTFEADSVILFRPEKSIQLRCLLSLWCDSLCGITFTEYEAW